MTFPEEEVYHLLNGLRNSLTVSHTSTGKICVGKNIRWRDLSD